MALEQITQVAGRGVYVPGEDIDTDRIIPARFMKCVTFDGLGQYLFYDVRFEENGTKKAHPLNDPRFANRPMILETPKEDDEGNPMDPVNLGLLRKMVRAM